MRNVTKQGRKRKVSPSVNVKGRVTGKIGYGQSNKMISTLRRMIKLTFDSYGF